MPSIQISIPSVLADCTGGRTRIQLEAQTIADALARLRDQFPLLRLHLFDESDHLRRHVLIFHNGQNIAWLNSLDVPLQEGDELAIVQAVSGGGWSWD